MSSTKFIKKICRICLGDKRLFDWNKEIFEFCGLTYKDCYYNYVQFDEKDLSIYPNQLCEMCGNELKNAHFLFERAVESFYILRSCTNSNTLFSDYTDFEISECMPMRRIQSEMYQSVEFSEHINKTDETHENTISFASDNNSIAENQSNNYQEILMSNIDEMNSEHFANGHKLTSSPEVLWKQQLCRVADTDFAIKSLDFESKDSKTNANNLLKTNSDYDKRLPKATVSENAEETIMNYPTTSENSLDQNISEEYESIVLQPTKNRKKYILICQYCSLEVDGTNQLIKHEATHSENRERAHTCGKCGLKLYTQSSLNEHMKIHDENRQKKHKCEFCEKAFYNKGALNVHRRIHLGLMLKCQICSKEFFRQIDLDRHLPSHSASPVRKTVLKKKKYVVQCQYCNKTVLTTKLREHMAIHSNQPQMKCKICDKPFYTRTKCVNHLRRFHRKDKSEYDDFIHNFVNSNVRTSLLRIKQSAKVETITK